MLLTALCIVSGCSPASFDSQLEPASTPNAPPRRAGLSARVPFEEGLTVPVEGGQAVAGVDGHILPSCRTRCLAQSRRSSARRQHEQAYALHDGVFDEHFDAKRYPEALSPCARRSESVRMIRRLCIRWRFTHRADNHPRRAEASLERAVAVEPDHLECRKLLCVLLMDDERCAAATAQIDHVVAAGNADAEAYLLAPLRTRAA